MAKFRQACRPLGIRVGWNYFVKRSSVLKYFQGIIRGTFRALLALKGT